jgi:hypothetical protein
VSIGNRGGPPRAGVSLRAYAVHRGVTDAAVRKAIRSGRITPLKDGSIDVALADRQWDSTTDPAKPRNSVTGDPKHHRDPSQPPTPMKDRHRGEQEPLASGDSGYTKARTIREITRAQKEQYEFDLQKGDSVRTADVRLGAFACAQKRLDSMNGLAARCAPLVATTDSVEDCRRIIQEKVDEIAAELHVAIKFENGRTPSVPG